MEDRRLESISTIDLFKQDKIYAVRRAEEKYLDQYPDYGIRYKTKIKKSKGVTEASKLTDYTNIEDLFGRNRDVWVNETYTDLGVCSNIKTILF